MPRQNNDFLTKEIPLDINELSFRFAGKLLLRNEIPINEPDFQQLLHDDYFQPVPSFSKTTFTKRCKRCGNKKASLLGMIPCQSCGQTHLYCRNCIEMGRVMECEPLYIWKNKEPNWESHKNPCTWEGQLTTAQKQASERIVLAVQAKEKEFMIWAVCGSGKTEMLFPCITEGLQTGKRICIATPRADVVRELQPRLQNAFSRIHIQGLYGGSKDNDGTAQIIIATTHQLLRYKEAFDILIIDEIDAFPYHADPSLPFAAERSIKKEGLTIYLTATPRTNHKNLIGRNKLPHTFVPSRFHGHPLSVPVLKICFTLKKALKSYRPPALFLKWIACRDPNRQLLIFVPTIKLAEKMKSNLQEMIQQEGVDSVHAEDKAREEKVQLFRKKKINVLITTTILERGVTFPSVDVAVIDAGHIVFDEAALVQIAGRAGRSPDDPTGEVVFFHDGKTDAMVQAIQAIVKMNKRAGL